jgi:heat-inducible transcriptional repressor
MSDLEDLGFLEQPHTSAGRVPSDKGYRLYVDELMDITYPNEEETIMIKRYMEIKTINEIEKIIKRTTKLLSEVTRYTSAVLTPSVSTCSVKSIQLIQISLCVIIAVIITDTAMIKHLAIRLPRHIHGDTLQRINNMLNEKLTGLSVQEINLSVISSIQSEIAGYNEILNAIIPALYECLSSQDCDMYLEGASNIFQYPEYNDLGRARDFLSLIEHKDVIQNIISDGDIDLSVIIGKENELEEVKECSIIRTSYCIGGRNIGRIGIIGPKRMNYSKVIGVLKSLADTLSDVLNDSLDE